MAREWIKSAISHPGALKAKAKKAGAMTPQGTIEKGWIAAKTRAKGTTGRQARLAQTLGKMKK